MKKDGAQEVKERRRMEGKEKMTMTRDGKLCKQRQWAYLRYFWNSGEKERDLTVEKKTREREKERERGWKGGCSFVAPSWKPPTPGVATLLVVVMLISRVERYSLLEASLFVQPRSFFSLSSLFRCDLIFFFLFFVRRMDCISSILGLWLNFEIWNFFFINFFASYLGWNN